jgi:hypothetical protein
MELILLEQVMPQTKQCAGAAKAFDSIDQRRLVVHSPGEVVTRPRRVLFGTLDYDLPVSTTSSTPEVDVWSIPVCHLTMLHRRFKQQKGVDQYCRIQSRRMTEYRFRLIPKASSRQREHGVDKGHQFRGFTELTYT